jgi:3-deoxy-D-arabino-heptulosonate 7-phosphate (DAHP) synthase class II
MHGKHDRVRLGLQDAPLLHRARRGQGLLRGARRGGHQPGGLHVELTGDDVTEVLGGPEDLDDDHLADRYETLVDRA